MDGSIGMSHEGVKLRLRGRGSGFLEGPEQRESHDPLNLCVSSKDKDKYLYACQQVERLLERVYTEYRYFDRGKMFNRNNQIQHFPIQIKKEESITGPKSLFEVDNKEVIQDLLLHKPQNSGGDAGNSVGYKSNPSYDDQNSPLYHHLQP